MKYLRISLFVLLAILFCGAVPSHASGIDFHATVLDPAPYCLTPDNNCFIYDQASFPVTFSSAECALLNLPGGANAGCFFGVNATGETITSLSLSLDGTTGLGTLSCDSASNAPGLPPSLFGNASCSQSGSDYDVLFSGGGIGNLESFIIYETGAPPADLGTDSAQLLATPEPGSLLLFSTGVMMAGLYMSKRNRSLASLKK
jgi:hypothetical protein